MTTGDWANAAVNLLIGILLGWSAYGLAGLTTTPFWTFVILIPALFFGVLLLDRGLNAAPEWLLYSGVKPAPRRRRKPLARSLSLPLGLAIGLVVAWLGHDLPFVGVA